MLLSTLLFLIYLSNINLIIILFYTNLVYLYNLATEDIQYTWWFLVATDRTELRLMYTLYTMWPIPAQAFQPLYFYTSILLYFYTSILIYFYTFILLYLYTFIFLYFYTFILLYFYTFILLYFYTSILLYFYTYLLIYFYTFIYI